MVVPPTGVHSSILSWNKTPDLPGFPMPIPILALFLGGDQRAKSQRKVGKFFPKEPWSRGSRVFQPGIFKRNTISSGPVGDSRACFLVPCWGENFPGGKRSFGGNPNPKGQRRTKTWMWQESARDKPFGRRSAGHREVSEVFALFGNGDGRWGSCRVSTQWVLAPNSIWDLCLGMSGLGKGKAGEGNGQPGWKVWLKLNPVDR